MELNCSLHPSADFIFYLNTPFGALYRCPECGVVFFRSVPRKKDGYYYGAADYDKYYSIEDEIKADRTLNFILKAGQCRALFSQREKIPPSPAPSALEIGPGLGLLSKKLQKYFDIDLVEEDEKLFTALKQNGFNVHKSSFEDFITAKKYDLIIMSDVLEHSLNPLSFLKKASLVLKNGGLIYIEVPNINSLYFKFAKQKWIGINPYHNFYFNLKSLNALFAELSLKIIKKDTYEGEILSFDALKRFGFFYKTHPRAAAAAESPPTVPLSKLKTTLKKINSKKGVKLAFAALNLPFSFLLNKFHLGDQLRTLVRKT